MIDKEILNVIAGTPAKHVPLWLMRQAGRYLPEYRALRSQAKNFLHLCLTPEWATEITLQPIRRFGMDAAILFADILLIPHALGQKLEFVEGEGPRLDPLQGATDVAKLNYNSAPLQAVMETVGRVKSALPGQTTLIGFCGGAWTVAAYMIDGSSRADFARAKDWSAQQPSLLNRLLETIVAASADYLCDQIKAGAEVVQIFESWAGLLDGAPFERFVIKPTAELVRRVKEKYPAVPIIGFPRAAADYNSYAQKTGIDVLGLDQHIDLTFARGNLKPLKILQGNLDPVLLVKGGAEMRAAAEKILASLGPRHIFNLGHGVVPETPPEHVAELVKIVQGWRA